MFSRLFRGRSAIVGGTLDKSSPTSSSDSRTFGKDKDRKDNSGKDKDRKDSSAKDKEKDKKERNTFPRRSGPSRDAKRSGPGSKDRGDDGSKRPAAKSAAPQVPTFSISDNQEVHVFKEEDLAGMSASYKLLIGKGGFGSVYKGSILDSATKQPVDVAVKILHSEEQDMEEDLMREIVAVAKLKHPCILRLLGYCNSSDTKAMVYDFMPGGDVDELLKKSREGKATFAWDQRVEVALGCAKALAFIHDHHYVHRDFKSSNVLLTEDKSPRLADFGLVKAIQDWHSHCTTKVKGSIGYIDPMYFTIGHVHTKSDVYAYGVFLVELITGKSVYQDAIHETVIPDLTAGKVTEAVVKNILDPMLPQDDKRILQQAKILAELARRSLQDHWEGRPNMKDLVQKITRLKAASSQKDSGSEKETAESLSGEVRQ